MNDRNLYMGIYFSQNVKGSDSKNSSLMFQFQKYGYNCSLSYPVLYPNDHASRVWTIILGFRLYLRNKWYLCICLLIQLPSIPRLYVSTPNMLSSIVGFICTHARELPITTRSASICECIRSYHDSTSLLFDR